MIDFKQKMREQEREERKAIPNWDENESIITNKKRKRIVTYIIAVIVIVLVFSGKVIMSSQSSSEWISDTSFLGKIKHLVSSVDKKLEGEKNDRINILFLGMGGKGHDGAYLTDTIMLMSLKPSTKQVSLISLPRDLAGPINGGSSWQRINNVNAYAEAAEKGSGGEATIEALSNLLQIPIAYYIRVDFEGFIDIIDELGGIKVYVENTFDDYSYPITGEESNPDYYARFEHLHFDEGEQKMNGSLALKYARSRHASGIEGSDFARAERQQLILEAVKEKLLSRQTLLNPVTVGKLVGKFNDNVSTNLKVWEMIKLWNISKDIDRSQITNKVLSDAPGNFLVNSFGEDGAFLLVPKTGNFSEIRNMVQNIFYIDVPVPERKIEALGENSKVIIMNGTWISGLAGKAKTNLEKYEFNIVEIGNTDIRDYTDSIIYDLSYGRKGVILESLEEISNADQSFNLPDWAKEYREKEIADFILILGTEAN